MLNMRATTEVKAAFPVKANKALVPRAAIAPAVHTAPSLLPFFFPLPVEMRFVLTDFDANKMK